MRRWARVVAAAAPIVVCVVGFVPAAQADTPCPITDPTCVLAQVGQTVGNVGQTVGQTAGSVGQTVNETTTTVANTINSTTKTVAGTIGQVTGGSKAPGGGDQGGTDPGAGGTSGPHGGGIGIGSAAGGSRAILLVATHQHRGQVPGTPVRVSVDDNSIYRLPHTASDPGGSLIQRILPEAASLAVLALLTALAIAFLTVQDRIDRRDPKLAATHLGSDRVRFG